MNRLIMLWLQRGLWISPLQATLACLLLLAVVLSVAYAYRRFSSASILSSEFNNVQRIKRRLCVCSKLCSALHIHAGQQTHQVPGRQLGHQKDRSLRELVNDVAATADAFDLVNLEHVLAALVEEGFKEPSKVEAMCKLGLADSLRCALSKLAFHMNEAHVQKNVDTAGMELGAACLQASWLLVQLASGSHETRMAISHGITVTNVVAFMRALAPAGLLAPFPGSRLGSPGFARISAGSSELRASSSSGLGQADGYKNSSGWSPSSVPTTHSYGHHPKQQQASCVMLKKQLPRALVDAVLRNCSWCLLLLCDVAWALPTSATQAQEGLSGAPSIPEAKAGDTKQADVELAIEFSRELLFPSPPVHVQQSGLCSLDGAAAIDQRGKEGPPADVLVRLVQGWEGLEASVTAAAVLACVTFLSDLDASLAQHARDLLLASPTFGNVCEALCRASASISDTPADVPASAGTGLHSAVGVEAAATPTGLASSRSLTRACAVLSQFLSHTLSQPQSAGLLLRQTVAEHAVSWLLHASALPLALRRQLLRQLLGTEGHGALSAAAAQLVDAPLALCHIISAPAACHSLLAPDVTGYLLTAVPFGFAILQPSPQAKPQQDTGVDSLAAPVNNAQVNDTQQQQVQEQDVENHQTAHYEASGDAAWEPDAALLGAQALGGPQDLNDEDFMYADRDDIQVGEYAHQEAWAGDAVMGLGAAAADEPGAGAAGNAYIPAGAAAAAAAAAAGSSFAAGAERYVSTLAVACRLLLACDRLDNAFGAFLSDLRVAGRAALNRRSQRNGAPAGVGYPLRGSLDGRLREFTSATVHQRTTATLRSSNGRSSGGASFSGGSGMAEGCGLSFPDHTGGGSMKRMVTAAWGLASSERGGGGGSGAAGSLRSSCQAGTGGSRGAWCWQGVGGTAMLVGVTAGSGGGNGGISHGDVSIGGGTSGGAASAIDFRGGGGGGGLCGGLESSVGCSGAGCGSDKACQAPLWSTTHHPPVGVLTDVMAGVAGLIDAMLWQSPSLGGRRCFRGSFIDHYDSMSDSESIAVASSQLSHEIFSGEGGGVYGSAAPVLAPTDQQTPSLGATSQPVGSSVPFLGRMRHLTAASGMRLSGAGARAVGLRDVAVAFREDSGSCHVASFVDWQGRMDSTRQVLHSTERGESDSRSCSQSDLLQWPPCKVAAAFGLQYGGSSGGDVAMSHIAACAVNPHAEQEHHQPQQQPPMRQALEEDNDHSQLAPSLGPGAVATWLNLPSTLHSTQPPKPEIYPAATSSSPPRVDPEPHLPPQPDRRNVIPYWGSSTVGCNDIGEVWSGGSGARFLPLQSFSHDETSGQVATPTATGCKDHVSRASEFGTHRFSGSGIGSANVVPEDAAMGVSEFSPLPRGARVSGLGSMKSDNGLEDAFEKRNCVPRSNSQRGFSLGLNDSSDRDGGRESDITAEAAKLTNATAAQLLSLPERDRLSGGSSAASQLPPYTYFGSAQLTAAALALPVDVATRVTSMLSATGGSSNSAASRIAIAAAAAAAASSAGAAGATTAATTLAASAASAKTAASRQDANATWSLHTAAAAGEGQRPFPTFYDTLSLREEYEFESDTQLAMDIDAANSGSGDATGNDNEPSANGLDASGSGYTRSNGPQRQGFFPGLQCALIGTWRGIVRAPVIAAADASAPPPSSTTTTQRGVHGGSIGGNVGGGLNGLQEQPSPRLLTVATRHKAPWSSGSAFTALEAGLRPDIEGSSAAGPLPAVMNRPTAPPSASAYGRTLALAASSNATEVVGGRIMGSTAAATTPSPWTPSKEHSYLCDIEAGCAAAAGEAPAELELVWSSPFGAQEACRSAGWLQPSGPFDMGPEAIKAAAATAVTTAAVPPAAAATTTFINASIALSVPDSGMGCNAGAVVEGRRAVFMFGNEQVEVPCGAFRTLRHSSPLLYSWLCRVPDPTRPITILRVPGLDDSANRRVFLQLLSWTQGVRDVEQLLLPQHRQPPPPPPPQPLQQKQKQQRQQQQSPLLWCGSAVSPALAKAPCAVAPDAMLTSEPGHRPGCFPWFASAAAEPTGCGGGGGVEPLEQLWQLWRAADYLQVDELLTAVEDELAHRFTLPPPHGPAAWTAALSLAGSQQHFLGAMSRLAHLCAQHFMRRVWGVLGDEELLIAAGAGAGVLGPVVAAEVRDRLVALVALADLDLPGTE